MRTKFDEIIEAIDDACDRLARMPTWCGSCGQYGCREDHAAPEGDALRKLVPAIEDAAATMRELLADLRAKAQNCRSLADKPHNGSNAALARHDRLVGKATAYGHAAELLAAALFRAGVDEQ